MDGTAGSGRNCRGGGGIKKKIRGVYNTAFCE